MSKQTQAEKNAKLKAAQKKRRYEKPLTYAEGYIMKMLPKEGTRVGIKEVGIPVRDLAIAVGEKSDYMNGLIRSLLARNHVVEVELIPRNQGRGYQRTARGEEFLNDWETEYGAQDQR